MTDGFAAPQSELSSTLVDTWASQGLEGFLLIGAEGIDMPVREVVDPRCGVNYRFRWMPHRELRGDVAELQRRGILNPDRDESKLFRDPRDPNGRHCFLCADNIAECNPMEKLISVTLAGRKYLAGANFAWIEPNHFTVMDAEHMDQRYTRHVLDAMYDLHVQAAGQFRVLFNAPDAGATIPWHRHFQITTAPMPIEQLPLGREGEYPTAVCRIPLGTHGLDRAHFAAKQWLEGDPQNRRVNILIASPGGKTSIFVFPRDQRHATAPGKGLIGGFEVAGDFVLSSPKEQETFRKASAEAAREILKHCCPPDWTSSAAA